MIEPFHTITAEDWKRQIAAARATPSDVAEQIRDRIDDEQRKHTLQYVPDGGITLDKLRRAKEILDRNQISREEILYSGTTCNASGITEERNTRKTPRGREPFKKFFR